MTTAAGAFRPGGFFVGGKFLRNWGAQSVSGSTSTPHGLIDFFAYKAKVYDVSRNFLWQGRRHFVIHHAGTDLTSSLEQAPPRTMWAD